MQSPSSLLPLYETPSGYSNALLYSAIAGLVAVLFALVVSYSLFNAHLAQQKQQLNFFGAKTAANFDHEMTVRAYSVNAICKTAEQYMSGKSQLAVDITRYLRPTANSKGYTLALPPGYSDKQIGNITGAGNIPARNTPASREMAMTVGLMPLFQSLIARDADTPWIYYTSQNRFTHIYPRVSPKVFTYTDKSLEYDVFTMALPKNNPQRKLFWTPPYQDEAGKGMMVTVAAPVYEGDDFRGTVAVDILLSKLTWLLDSHKFPQSSVYLYSQNGEFLAGSSNDLGYYPAEVSPKGAIAHKDKYISEFTLQSAPWRVLIVTSRKEMFNEALLHALPFALVVATLFISVILLIVLIIILRKAQECSVRDGLTGLFNRRYFDIIASREISGSRRDGHYFGLIMLDIDYFKQYNDTYGHQKGDTMLKLVSRVLAVTLKRPMDQAFRVGGEEFAIVSRAERPEQIEMLAHLLHKAIESCHFDYPASTAGHLTISVGVAIVSPTNVTSVDALYAKADQALYRAKHEGRNRVVSMVE